MKSIESIAQEFANSDEHRVQLKHDEIIKYLHKEYPRQFNVWYGIEALRRTETYFKASYANLHGFK